MSDRSLRGVVVCSAVLGLAGFAGALAWLPDARPSRANHAPPSPPSLRRLEVQIRAAMAQGRPEAALRTASQATQLHPSEPEAWLWLVIASHHDGDRVGVGVGVGVGAGAGAGAGAMGGERLRSIIESRPTPADTGAKARRAYRLGWAMRAVGDENEARAHFRRAADLYGQAEPADPSPLRLYNLACYLALGGEHEQAAERFARCVDAGYDDADGWWRADPDLDPIRAHPVFAAAAERLDGVTAIEADPDAGEQAGVHTAPNETDKADETDGGQHPAPASAGDADAPAG